MNTFSSHTDGGGNEQSIMFDEMLKKVMGGDGQDDTADDRNILDYEFNKVIKQADDTTNLPKEAGDSEFSLPSD